MGSCPGRHSGHLDCSELPATCWEDRQAGAAQSLNDPSDVPLLSPSTGPPGALAAGLLGQAEYLPLSPEACPDPSPCPSAFSPSLGMWDLPHCVGSPPAGAPPPWPGPGEVPDCQMVDREGGLCGAWGTWGRVGGEGRVRVWGATGTRD